MGWPDKYLDSIWVPIKQRGWAKAIGKRLREFIIFAYERNN
jgi:hypothetical protein